MKHLETLHYFAFELNNSFNLEKQQIHGENDEKEYIDL